MAFEIKKNDRRPHFRVQLTANDSPADLTGAVSVSFQMYTSAGGSAKVAKTVATIVDAPTGVVEYAWIAGDTDTAGDYVAEFEVNWGGSETQTFPNNGFFAVKINADLG